MRIKCYRQITIVIVLMLSFSCKNSSLNPNDNQGGRPKYGGRPANNQDITSFPDPDESGPEYGDKVVEWSDGNTYTYDYTQEVELKDSTGTKNITIYMRNKPTDVDCDILKCEWCGKEMVAEDYLIEEYPDVNLYRGQRSAESFLSIMMSALVNKRYFDLEHNKIRTEWRVNCDYGGPDGFCSLKCKSEYNGR